MSTTLEQALHIFRKDARHLRGEIIGGMTILLLFVLTGIQTWDDILKYGRASNFDGPFVILLPLGAVILTARVIQDEALPGDRHFWLTRPYSRSGLVIAKLLFIGAFIHAPLLIAQAAIILLSGLPLAPYIGGLLWMQVATFAAVVAPTVAIAALTRNLAQFLAATVLTMAFTAVAVASHDWAGDLDWIRAASGIGAALIIATLIVWRQYRLRRTLQTAALATTGSVLAAVGYMAFPHSAAVAIQTSVVGSHDDRFSIALGQPEPLPAAQRNAAERYGLLEFPLAVTGADAANLAVTPVNVTIRTLAGDTRHPSYRTQIGRNLKLITSIDRDFFKRAQNAPVTLEAEYLITQYGAGESASVPMDGTPTFINELGQCGATVALDVGSRVFVCRNAFRQPAKISSALVNRQEYVDRWWTSYTPFPAAFSLHPVFAQRYEMIGPTGLDLAPSAPEPPATIAPIRPVAFFRYTMRIPDVRLANYAVPPKERDDDEE